MIFLYFLFCQNHILQTMFYIIVTVWRESHCLAVHMLSHFCYCLKNSWLRFSALASLPPPSLKSIFDFWYLLIVVIWLLLIVIWLLTFAHCYLIIDISSLLFTHCYLMIEMTNLQVIRPSVTSTALSADWTQLQIIFDHFIYLYLIQFDLNITIHQ